MNLNLEICISPRYTVKLKTYLINKSMEFVLLLGWISLTTDQDNRTFRFSFFSFCLFTISLFKLYMHLYSDPYPTSF